jgi:hypothetical protein
LFNQDMRRDGEDFGGWVVVVFVVRGREECGRAIVGGLVFWLVFRTAASSSEDACGCVVAGFTGFTGFAERVTRRRERTELGFFGEGIRNGVCDRWFVAHVVGHGVRHVALWIDFKVLHGWFPSERRRSWAS